MGVRAEQCSCLHLQALLVMAPCGKIALLFLLADAALGARQLRNNQQRGSRSLTGTFPFNQQNGAEEQHHQHHEHQEVHDVEDDVVDCKTEVEEKCEDETSGYTTNTKCSKWPKEVCTVSKKPVKKYTPITGCTKEPRELCAPAGCGFKQGEEECYDKTQTVVQDAPKEQCSTSPSWCPSWSPPRSVWMYPRRCAPGPGPTPGRSRNLWSRSGATFLLKSLALHK